MKRMLINATQKEELRIAIINNKKLYDLKIENNKYIKKKYNIYKGKIIRIEQSLEAVFIDYGETKYGFLPLKEILPKYFINKKKYSINNLYKNQELIVQIVREQRNNKGAVLTTFISLIGNYLVLMPNNNIIGISKKIEGKKRKKIKKIIKKLKLPKNMGIIIRTSGIDKSINTFKLDLLAKLKNWKYIKKKFKKYKLPSLIYKQNNIFIRIFREYLNNDIKEIIIDNYKTYILSINYIKKLNKIEILNKIIFYKKEIPLFTYFKIENQIESAFNRVVKLPSGGSITIDITEALTSIDVNSSKYNKEKNIEITALNTNLEASKEIAKQIRLRDLGGLIVIDFIDMNILKNQKIVEKKFKKVINKDKAKTQIGYISKFGLLEMSRQRLNLSLKESSYYICPRCKGSGIIRDNESLSLLILRIIQEKSFKKNTKKIYVIAPIKIANYILNKKKNILNNIKKKNIKTIIIPNKNIQTPNYSIIITKYKKKKINNKKKSEIIKLNNILNIKKNIKINKNIIYNKKKYNNKFYNIIKNIYKYIKNLILKFKTQKYFICNRIIYKNKNLIIKEYNKIIKYEK